MPRVGGGVAHRSSGASGAATELGSQSGDLGFDLLALGFVADQGASDGLIGMDSLGSIIETLGGSS